jgi:uncharacterized protein (TIGR03083 family)
MSRVTKHRASLLHLAEEEDRRMLELLRSLSPTEWSATTECPGWDVRAMAAHIVGTAETARPRESIHQLRAGRKAAGSRVLVDGINDVQIAERSGLTTTELIERLASAAPRLRRLRRRLPAPVRWIGISGPGDEKVTVGRLADALFTRDTWMHRVDIHRAIGRPIPVDGHDAAIVADVVAEWTSRHGKAYDLRLTGPAGGHFSAGMHGEHHELDAVEFCRIVSGRGHGRGLLATTVPF